MSVDLIKAAEGRKYVKFEELALDALNSKLKSHPKVQEFKDSIASLREDSKKRG